MTNLETAEDTEAEKTPLKELILEPENSKASKQEDEEDKHSQSSEGPQAAAEN